MRVSATRIDMDDKVLQKPVLKDYAETVVTANSGTSYTIDYTTGSVFNITLTGNCAFTFSNPPASGISGSFTLFLTQDGTGGRTVTWPAAVKWFGNTAPTIYGNPDSVNILTFLTVNGGTTWFGANAEGFNSAIVATGGTVTTDGNFKVHTFTTGGTFEITSGSGDVEYLVVGGGGGSGRTSGSTITRAGAGGAGGLKSGTLTDMGVQSISITVGGGGVAVGPGGRRGDPLARPVGCGGAAVERGVELRVVDLVLPVHQLAGADGEASVQRRQAVQRDRRLAGGARRGGRRRGGSRGMASSSCE